MEIKQKRWHNLIGINDKDLPWLKFKYLYNFIKSKKWKVLEVGCWSWKNLRSLWYYTKGLQLYWLDIDKDAIAEWEKLYGKFINFYCASWDNMPFKENYFDYIIISDYLEHVSDDNLAICEMHRVLKKWWFIHAFIPCEWQKFGIYWIFKKIFWFNIKKTWGHTQFFTKQLIKKKLKAQWFVIKDIKYSYHVFWQFMDFLLYSLLLNKAIARLRRNKNKYYNDNKISKSWLGSIAFNSLLSIANYIAYIESSLFKKVSFGGMWMHLILNKIK
jgi:SAM-dependent methyltransferase